MRRFLIAFAALAAFAVSDAQDTCDVGEHERIPGLCRDGKDLSKCTDYCKKKYGDELVGAKWSEPRKNGKRECICKLKCCNQGCWGDPHCWTCDGVKFGYQGLKTYYVLKPVKNFPTLPEFEVRQSNKPWQNGPMAILDISTVIIRDWEHRIELKVPHGNDGYILTVNEKRQEIPYRFSELDDFREHFINIVYGDPQKTQVVLTTSFGLRIVYTTKNVGQGTMYSDISIDTPRHPELKDNVHGLLGRWNGNPDDDSIDATGKKQPLDDGFSWAFGDSWIVPEGRTPTADCVRDEANKKHKHKLETIDVELKQRSEVVCTQILENPQLKKCANDLGRAVPMVKNCVTDLIFMEDDEARKNYIQELIDSFATTCKRRGHEFTNIQFTWIIKTRPTKIRTHGSSSSSSSSSGSHEHPKNPHKPNKPHNPNKPHKHHEHKPKQDVVVIQKPITQVVKCTVNNLVPLYRLYRPASDNHFYTTNFEEANNAARNLGYTPEGSPGMVATTAQAGLAPVYRLYKPGAKEDHFYTQNEQEAANAAAKLGYVREGIAYYCPTQSYCGASQGLIRYWRGTDHFYTTSRDEGNRNVIPHGGKDEGILCHIWANNGPVRQPGK